MKKAGNQSSLGEIQYLGSFPSDENSTKLKRSEGYGVAWGRAIYSSARQSSFSYSFDNQYDKVIRNRKFARGQHSVEEYKPRAIPVETEYVTVDYSITTPLPKFMRITKDNIYNHAYRANVTPYDSYVHTKYEEEKNKILSKMALAKNVRNMVAEGTAPESMLADPRIAKAPKNQEEAEAMMETTFQVIEAIALEKIIKATFSRCKMPKIERKVVTDLVESNHGAIYCGVDENYNPDVRYIDLLNLVTSYCEYDDFSDATHMGHRRFITVGELRKRLQGRLSEEEIFNIAKSNIGKRINEGNQNNWPNYRYFQSLSNADKRALETVMVEVFDFEVLISEKSVYREKKLDSGGFDYSKKGSEYKGTSKNVETDSGIITKIYRGEWIVDHDYMLSWGVKPNVIRKIRNGKYESTPCFSYIVRKPDMLEMSNVSMCEEAIPHIEQMILYQIKLQHFVAVAKPSGFSYNVAALTAALPGMGLDELTPVDMADITTSLGNNYYSSITEDGEQILDPNPVRPNPTTLGDGVRILAELYNAELFKVKDILGLNQAVDSSEPTARVNQTAQQLAYQAHKASIKGLQDTYLEMMDEVAERIAYTQQMAIQADVETDEIKELLSDPELKTLKMKDVGEMNFNTEITLEPDNMQKASLIEKINLAVQQQSLAIEDAIQLENMIEESGGVEKAKVIFAQLKRQRQREQQESMQAQMQAEQQAIQSKMQADLQLAQQLAQIEIQKEQAKKDLELRNALEIEEAKRVTMTLEYQEKEELVETQAREQAKANEKKDVGSAERVAPPEPKADVSTKIEIK